MIIPAIILAFALLGGSAVAFLKIDSAQIEMPIPRITSTVTITPTPTSTPTPSPTPTPPITTVIHDVPFTVQAPYARWGEDIFQFACEEASILMAMSWVNGKEIISADEAVVEITEIANLAQSLIGTFYDESTSDTLRLLKAYYQYENVEQTFNVTKQDIIDTLYDGHVAIVATNGQILANPNFTPPGPIEHMLVVIGYDPATDEFITNDPGTSRGRHWRYDASLFVNAIQNYPTGYKQPITEIEKTMIVVSKI